MTAAWVLLFWAIWLFALASTIEVLILDPANTTAMAVNVFVVLVIPVFGLWRWRTSRG